MTDQHGTFSAAEAHEMAQAVRTKVTEQEVPRALNGIMAKIRRAAGQGKMSATFWLDDIYADRLPWPFIPATLIDGIVEKLSAQGYNVGVDRRKNFIMVGWGPSLQRIDRSCIERRAARALEAFWAETAARWPDLWCETSKPTR